MLNKFCYQMYCNVMVTGSCDLDARPNNLINFIVDNLSEQANDTHPYLSIHPVIDTLPCHQRYANENWSFVAACQKDS